MAYTKQEEEILNKQLKRWQKRQLTAVRTNNIDSVFEMMSDFERAAWEQVAKAESYKEVSLGAWMFAGEAISKYCIMAQHYDQIVNKS